MEVEILKEAHDVANDLRHDIRSSSKRGLIWWTDGAPDQNRRMVKNTSCADWYAGLPEAEKAEPSKR